MSNSQLSPRDLKAHAKALRHALEASGKTISHSQSLELLAKQHGFRDWNTLIASIGDAEPPAFQLKQRITGKYLGQPFMGEIVGIRASTLNNRYALTIKFDEAVDVVEADGFSNFRSRVHVTVDRNGKTVEKTSDGAPHLIISA